MHSYCFQCYSPVKKPATVPTLQRVCPRKSSHTSSQLHQVSAQISVTSELPKVKCPETFCEGKLRSVQSQACLPHPPETLHHVLWVLIFLIIAYTCCSSWSKNWQHVVCSFTGFCMFVLSLVKKHYRLQFYMVCISQVTIYSSAAPLTFSSIPSHGSLLLLSHSEEFRNSSHACGRLFRSCLSLNVILH